MSTPENRSYLAAGISAISPWGSRTATPRPQQGRDEQQQASEAPLGAQRGGDHKVSQRPRLSLKNYPRDCPPLVVQWYHAVDIPKRKPFSSSNPTAATKPPPAPKKWATFSDHDSRAIEATFQKLAEETEHAEREKLRHQDGLSSPTAKVPFSREDRVKRTAPVNEDFLFDVDIDERELRPAYWPGPVYEVRRGTWFYQEGSTQRPCDENLATQLEEGYLKLKPWKFPPTREKRSASQPRSRPTSIRGMEELKATEKQTHSNPITPKSSIENLKENTLDPEYSSQSHQESSPTQTKTYRLFGSYMNHVVTYENSTTAWLQKEDDLISRLGSTVYQRFAGGAHFAGQKIVRGYTASSKKSETKNGKRPDTATSVTSKDSAEAPRESTEIKDPARAFDTPEEEAIDREEDNKPQSPSEIRRATLERQMSNLVAAAHPEDPAQQEEEVRKRDEQEIKNDYKDQEGDEQGREIEHLLLITHGIGQRLGLRMESVNFIHDVNTLRKTLKAVYANSADLQALNSEIDKIPKNCRIQVLPICWRHLLDFPKQSLKHIRKEHDLGDLDFEDHEYPNLDDIQVEGVPAVRNLITDLALDILLYQSPAYKGHITRIVLEECNRIYKLFKERNPSFNGKVSLVGHSLGSAIMFDILCQQLPEGVSAQRLKHRGSGKHLKLDFEVEDFYALGSPIGLFQMLKGRRIVARQSLNFLPPETPGESMDDPFLGPASESSSWTKSAADHFEITTSSPKCQRIFNVFHPTDPISYRIEPLISPAMSSLKPQLLPYTKKGIFGAPVGQGIAGIGAMVTQSVSGLWTNLSSGIASSLLNRSLGLSAEDAGKLGNPLPGQQPRAPLSIGSGTNVGGGVIPAGPIPIAETDQSKDDKKRRLDTEGITEGDVGEHPATLIDTELETLYAGFQKRRKSQQSEGDTKDASSAADWHDLEDKSRRLRREEAKVRALNSNGRVDYSIQEGAFDISIIASIASHLSYWADEDVCHFMISQLLARHRILKKSNSDRDLKA